MMMISEYQTQEDQQPKRLREQVDPQPTQQEIPMTLTEEIISKMIANHPVVKQLQGQVSSLTNQLKELEEKYNAAQAKQSSPSVKPVPKPDLPKAQPAQQTNATESWATVAKKGLPKHPQEKQPPQTFSQQLKVATSEQQLKLLIRQPLPDSEKATNIVKTPVSIQLTQRAQAQPLLAWKTAIKAVTKQEPLLISLTSLNRADIYWDAKLADSVTKALREKGYLGKAAPSKTPQQLNQAAKTYMRGYFPLLRQSILEEYSPSERETILSKAEEMSLKLEKRQSQRWKYQISQDRIWLSTNTIPKGQPEAQEVHDSLPPSEEEEGDMSI